MSTMRWSPAERVGVWPRSFTQLTAVEPTARPAGVRRRRLRAQPGPWRLLLGASNASHRWLCAPHLPASACWKRSGSLASRRPALRALYIEALDALRARLTEPLEAARAAGAILHPDPAVAAAALLALVQGYFQLAASAPGFVPGGSAAASARAMAHGLLRAPEPEGPR